MWRAFACWWLLPVASLWAAGTFDLAVIGEDYTDRARFEADAQRAFQAILRYAPFSEFAGQTQFLPIWNTKDLGCYYSGRLLRCDWTKTSAVLAASGVVFDKLIILVNNGTYGGSGGNWTISYNGALMPGVVVHEFGHSLGNLFDEYTVSSAAYPNANREWGNCWLGAAPPATTWPLDASYSPGCHYPTWKRSTPCSIMKSLSCPYFNEVSKRMIRQRVLRYLQ